MELKLPLMACYRFELQATAQCTMPSLDQGHWIGSVVRGTLGNALRQATCITGKKSCRGCVLLPSCVYARFFEQAPGIEIARGKHLHPFALHFPKLRSRFAEGDVLPLEIRLFGRAIQDAPYFIHALRLAAEKGFGRYRAKFHLQSVLVRYHPQDNWHKPGSKPPAQACYPPIPNIVRVHLTTPLRIRYQKRLVGAETLTARIFLAQLWNRARNLEKLAEEGLRVPAPEHAAENILMTEKNLHWVTLRRWSGRQKTEMCIDGLLGSFELSGTELARWWPLLWYGQWMQLGKLTSMGMGAYSVEGKLAKTHKERQQFHTAQAEEALG